MKPTPESLNARIESFLTRHERLLLWALCALAMLRVFFFAAAFPFFNNVDEQAHFDTIVKYSKGYLPRKDVVHYERESAELIVLYGSPEYFKSPADFHLGEIPPPLWRFHSDQLSEQERKQIPEDARKQLSQLIAKKIDKWTERRNPEVFCPPIYYALAGAWYDLGKLCGLTGGRLLYWLRFLNLPVYALLFWFVRLLCKNVYENDRSMQFGVLLLLAVFPQDVFYSLNRDVLSPLVCVMSLYLLLQIYTAERSLLFHALTGAAVASTFLVKLSNCPMLILLAIVVSLTIRKLGTAGRLKERLPNLLLLVSGCSIPILLWLGWNAFVLDDLTGNTGKIRFLGWTMKPLTEMWDHPIFTLKGLTYFVSELLKSFWRGEFVWGLHRLASTGMDFFYVISSCVFVLISVINTQISKDDYAPNHRFLNNFSALVIFLSVLFLAVLSIMYDFGESWFPSREFPFFSAGRLILGVLVPFLILYLDGLRITVSRISAGLNIVLPVIALCILITYTEIKLTYAVLESNYNLFHL